MPPIDEAVRELTAGAGLRVRLRWDYCVLELEPMDSLRRDGEGPDFVCSWPASMSADHWDFRLYWVYYQLGICRDCPAITAEGFMALGPFLEFWGLMKKSRAFYHL